MNKQRSHTETRFASVITRVLALLVLTGGALLPSCSGCLGSASCAVDADCGEERLCVNDRCGDKGVFGSCEAGRWVGNTVGADLDGDGIGNDAECAAGTDPRRSDTDRDGLGDAEEKALGTDPTLADTDGDGLEDGQEEMLGTDPLVADSDGDGLSDGVEVSMQLDPNNPDTDADRLLDGEESGYGTDPRLADTDGDGLLDGDEVDLGYDPLDSGDPAGPVKCEVLSTCAKDALRPMSFVERLPGDFRLALPASTKASVLGFSGLAAGDRLAGLAFDDAGVGNAGFLLSMEAPSAGSAAATELSALVNRLGTGSWPWTFVELISGRSVNAWDGYPAMVSARINLSAAGTDVGSVRAALVAALAGVNPSAVSGLPSAGSFKAADTFVVGLELLVRRNVTGDAGRVVVVGAVSDQASYDDKTQPARIQMADLANGTSLGQFGDREHSRCDSFEVTRDPRADFIWMSDTSGSTNDERGPIKQNVTKVFTALNNLGIDFRMAVLPHQNNSNNSNPGQFYAPGFTRDVGTFGAFWDLAGGNGREYGLLAVNDAIRPGGAAMPRTATEDANSVREGVKLVVVYVSDEHAQTVEDSCGGVRDRNKSYVPDAAGQACITRTVQPFVDVLKAESAVAFGIIPESPGGCQNPTNGTSSQEAGWGYKEVVEATGGSHGSVCASDPGQTLDDIVSAVAGAASSFQLQGAPISATIKVVVSPAGLICDPANPRTGRREVPRSASDGFDYDPVNNTIFFLGPSRPQIGDAVTVSYREWEDRSPDANPDPGGCTPDCGGCQAGYSCDAASCTCFPNFG